jgi:hypothetical protein
MSGSAPLYAEERETISRELSQKKSARYIAKLPSWWPPAATLPSISCRFCLPPRGASPSNAAMAARQWPTPAPCSPASSFSHPPRQPDSADRTAARAASTSAGEVTRLGASRTKDVA